MTGRNILVTGSTDGLGLAVATRAVVLGHTVFLHGRSAQRVEAAADRIEEHTGSRPTGVIADFSRLAEVASIPDQLAELTDHLDTVINNAGIGTGEPDGRHRSESADGYELRLAVNYLAPFSLTLRLLPMLERGTDPRIVNVASDGQAEVDFDNLMLTRDYSGLQAYCQSKLALVAFGFTLAAKTAATVNSLHPGSFMPTKIVLDDGAAVVDDLEGGVAAIFGLATDPAYAGVTGRYFERLRESRPLAQAYDSAFRDRLWRTSVELTGAPEPIS